MSEIPQWLCHKRVRAAKIVAVKRDFNGGGAYLDLMVYGGILAQPVTIEYIDKHRPEAGGYFVQYGDDYMSFSPAVAFEEGYTLVGTHIEEDLKIFEAEFPILFGTPGTEGQAYLMGKYGAPQTMDSEVMNAWARGVIERLGG